MICSVQAVINSMVRKELDLCICSNGVKIGPLIHGGAQERSRRAGTHNVPGIVGMGAATALAVQNMEENAKKQIEVRDYLISRIEKEIPYVKVNGHREKRLPNNVKCMLPI